MAGAIPPRAAGWLGRSAPRRTVLRLAAGLTGAALAAGETSARGPRRAAALQQVVWSADHETGDLSQWAWGQSRAVFNTGTGRIDVVEDVARSGRYSMRHSISGANGEAQATRIFRHAENLVDATYSAWLYVPQIYYPASWWNVFQFKSRDRDDVSQPTLVLNIANRSDGSMYFRLWSGVHGVDWDPAAEVTVPVGAWTNVNAYLRRSANSDGHVSVWHDGVLIYDMDTKTCYRDPNGDENIQWALSNYTDNIDPSDVTIYWDDAGIVSSG